MQTLDITQFTLLGERMKDAWDKASEDASVWSDFTAELDLSNMCARWCITGEGVVELLLEEHKSPLDAFWADRRNDGSIEPLRRIGWRKTTNGWENLT